MHNSGLYGRGDLGLGQGAETLDFSLFQTIEDHIARVIVGKRRAIRLLLIAVLAEGHVIIEDAPGLGKTMLAKALAKSIGGRFNRIQFTPDLLPADVTGFSIWDRAAGGFKFHPGPIICNVLLADEINRTIPRTQSSLLECMGERQVTVDGRTHLLPRPFLVIATQNPIELEGTFPLPEAQLDRFLIKMTVGYPDPDEEIEIMSRFQVDDPMETLTAVADPKAVADLQVQVRHIHVSDPVKRYIAALVQTTRGHEAFQYGASPRGSLALMRAAQASAALARRTFVLPDDVKDLAGPVLIHRVIPTEKTRLRGESAEEHLAAVVDRIEPPSEA